MANKFVMRFLKTMLKFRVKFWDTEDTEDAEESRVHRVDISASVFLGDLCVQKNKWKISQLPKINTRIISNIQRPSFTFQTGVTTYD